MKRSIIAFLIAIMVVGMLAPAASAEQIGTLEYSVSTTRLFLNQDGTGNFRITVPYAGAPFNSVNFAVRVPDGGSITEVTYNVEGVKKEELSETPLGIPPGELYPNTYIFACFVTGDHAKITADVACFVTVAYTGTTAADLTILKVDKGVLVDTSTGSLKTSGVNNYVSNVTRNVTLVPYGTGEGGPGGSGGSQGAPTGSSNGIEPESREELGEEEPPAGLGELGGPQLDMSNLKAYVNGYPDGTFHPNADITRAEAAQMLYSLIINEDKADYADNALKFSDVSADDWYVKPVGYLSKWEIIKGYPDGTFKGDDAITRAEFCAILTRFVKLDEGGALDFNDVEASHWAYDNILTAFNKGWIIGYPDGSFRPEASITRAEAVTMINRAIGRNVEDFSSCAMKFSDVGEDEWFYANILAASNDRPG